MRLQNFEFLPHFYILFQRKLREEDTKIPDEVDDPKLLAGDSLVRNFTKHNLEY